MLRKKKYVLNSKKKWSIVISDNIDNESEKRPKESKSKTLYHYFIQELFSCKGMKDFYDMDLNINYKQASEDIKDFIYISIANTVSPFYYNFLFTESNSDNEVNNECFSDDDDEEEQNNIHLIVSQLTNLMGNELTRKKINIDDP